MLEVTSPDNFLETVRSDTEQFLAANLPAKDEAPERLSSAIRYSVLGGGKRLRPALCLATARALGVQDTAAFLRPACAVELIHAYSLIHDDLPAMDDDDLRRGKPTVHIAYDEPTAILAGDALQTLAFEWLSRAEEFTADQRLAMIQELSAASGHRGMAGGQAIDLYSVGSRVDLPYLETMHRWKTGALIEASVALGALGCQRTHGQLQSLRRYAAAVGLAFQVQDDLLDVEGDTAVIGKPQGSDAARDKPTFPSLLGLNGAREYLEDLLTDSLSSLQGFGDEAEPLRALARFAVGRQH